MQQPLQIVWRGMEPSPALEANIREWVGKLEKFCDHIIGCRVVVEQLHRHKHRGNLYNVRVDIGVPGADIVVGHEHRRDYAHEDVYVATRDAFHAARRRLEDFVRRERGDVKSHAVPPHGRVVELSPAMDYGKLKTSEGRLVYFHRHSVVNGEFDKLEIGSEVRFVEEMGDQGPQASTVTVIGKHSRRRLSSHHSPALGESVTTSDKWAPKGINYRMHPDNIACLTAAQIDCCTLANNHVLDWGEAGLIETLETLELLDEAGVDVIHGHFSHHPKGIEVYKGKPILYGCGDFYKRL